MDYPKSVPSAGLVDGRFVDENPSTGQIGSLIPAAWANGLMQELLGVIKAAGLVPAEDDLGQLLKAVQTIAASDYKRSVRVATTGPIALSGLQAIDGVQLVAGDRVLVKNQANAAQNWIYTASAGSWQRAQDANESIECTPGHFVPVQSGTGYAGSVWQLTNTVPPVLGTTALVFGQSQGKTGVAAGTYRQVAVDIFGRVLSGENPTTLAGFGIADAIKSSTSAETLATFNAITPTNFYMASGKTSASATPGAPEASANGALGVLALTPRPGFTYYLAFEYSVSKAVNNVWVGRYASAENQLVWLPLLTGEFATQAEAETGTEETKAMSAKRVWQAITKRISTQSQVDAGTDDTTLVTPKKQRAGFAASFGSSGYIGLPTWLGGFMLQWGRASGSAGALVQAFPTSFSVGCYGVLGGGILGNINRVESTNVSAITVSNFTCNRSYSASGTAAGSATEHFFLAWGV